MVEDIYDVVYPYYIVSKILTYAPFPLKYPQTKKLFLKSFLLNLSYFLLSVAVQIWLIYKFLKSFTDDVVNNDTAVTAFTSQLLSLAQLGNYFITLGMNFCFQRSIQSLLAKISDTDLNFKKLGVRINRDFHRNFVIFYILGTFVEGILVILMHISLLEHTDIGIGDFEVYIVGLLATASFAIFIGHMLLPLIAIYLRFKILNRFFEKSFIIQEKYFRLSYGDFSGFVFLPGTNFTDQIIFIKIISTIHDQLNDIICTLNFCFAFQVRSEVTVMIKKAYIKIFS